MHITNYWDDHGNMTSVLPIEARGTSTCSLGGGKIAKKPIPPSLKPTKLENKVNIDMQPR